MNSNSTRTQTNSLRYTRGDAKIMIAQATTRSVLKTKSARIVTSAVLLVALCSSFAIVTRAKGGDDFNDVVKLIEKFYHVKHSSIPFLARAGIKTATTVARIAGGPKRQLAETGSVKVAFFEDQDFKPSASFINFKASMNAALAQSWSPLIQVTAPKADEQTYIYLRSAGDKFKVLVVTIAAREACVVQVTLAPQTLAKLLQNPDEMGETITVEATTDDRD